MDCAAAAVQDAERGGRKEVVREGQSACISSVFGCLGSREVTVGCMRASRAEAECSLSKGRLRWCERRWQQEGKEEAEVRWKEQRAPALRSSVSSVSNELEFVQKHS
jgi:hypothetical protein